MTTFQQLLEKARSTEGARLIDVRSAAEYQQGHVPGAENIPLNQLAALSADRNTPLFLYCKSGARSARGCKALTERMGFTNVTNIGGIDDYEGQRE